MTNTDWRIRNVSPSSRAPSSKAFNTAIGGRFTGRNGTTSDDPPSAGSSVVSTLLFPRPDGTEGFCGDGTRGPGRPADTAPGGRPTAGRAGEGAALATGREAGAMVDAGSLDAGSGTTGSGAGGRGIAFSFAIGSINVPWRADFSAGTGLAEIALRISSIGSISVRCGVGEGGGGTGAPGGLGRAAGGGFRKFAPHDGQCAAG